MSEANKNDIPTSKSITHEISQRIEGFFLDVTGDNTVPLPSNCTTHDFYSDILRDALKLLTIERGRVSSLLSLKPSLSNYYGGLHGGACAAVAEMLSTACARTVVPKEKDLFLGELGISYLSAAPKDSELMVDASIVRSGRNLTVVAVEMKLQKTGRLLYTARATFYNMPVAKL